MSANDRPELERPQHAVLFDLDGVLTDTASLHYESWKGVAADLGVPFNRSVNDKLRGLSRPESLAVLLGDRIHELDGAQQQALTDRKNAIYLDLVAKMTPADLLPGVLLLLDKLRGAGIATAVASSSRNALPVIQQLEIGHLLDAIVDANVAPRSKPDPQVFLAAAAALQVSASHCVVVEDATAGVAAAHAAEMRCIGVGDAALVGQADLVVPTLAELSFAELTGLLRRAEG
jgi:beta-phosphoglucomutase